LTSVVWDHGRIEFAYADDRLDLEGDIRLTSFSVFEKDADQARQVVEFNHEYFTSQNMGNEYATDRTPDVLKKRLKLVSVIKRPVPDPLHEEEKYSFRYYEGNESLPPKNSFAIDHWGYYNGRNSNASLIPSHKFFSSAVTIDDLLGVMGQERDPQAGYAKGFTLKEITYPTKGKTIFEYENNEFDAANVPPGTSDNPCQKETRVFYNGSEKGKVQTHYLDLTTQYVTAAGTTIPVELVAAFRAYGPCKDVVGFPKVYFELYQADGVSRISRVDLEMNNCATEEEKVCLYCDRGTQARSPVFTYRNTYALAPGKYIWKAYIPADDNQFADITANYIWWQTPSACTPVNEPDNTYKLAGGIRVSAVKDITPKETVNIKRYVYRYTSTEDGVTTTRSYGRRMSTPSYSYFDLNAEQQESGTIPVSATCLACVHLVRTSESTRSPFNSQGHSVGYDKVIELSGQNGEFGRTEYEYENRSDIFHNVKHWNDMPARPGTFSAYAHPLNGMLKSQTLFDANGDIVHKTTKTYEVVRGRSVYGLEERLAADINMVLPNFQLIAYRAMESNFIYESSSTEVSYVNNVPAAQTTTTFYYDNPRHLQLTRKVTTKSDLHQEITKIKYAADYSDAEADPAVLAMKSNDRYMHALPVEVSTIDQAPDGNQKVISQEITVYDHFGSFLFPKDKVLLSAQSPPDAADLAPYVPAAGYDLSLYRKVFSLDYDLNGNIRKVQKESDQPVTYLWGYGHNFPVAEIVGAEPEACFYSSFEDQGELYLDAAGKSIARTGTRVLTSSSYSFPASYTPDPASTVMSYWYWQNNAWQFSGIVPFQRTITHPGSRIDEVRAYPAKTMMKTYAYDPLAGITSLTDANNVTQHFEYDRMDRLKLVRNAEKEIVKAYHYRYRQDQ
ncbi:MAG TPA: hypothetical protein VEB86_13310, partial [Chryseosolibacter sp.]|nr:hypothetical protein [Chryseosolibacter sp.]